MIIDLTKNGVLDKFPALLDFWAEWCGPCKVTSNNLYKFSDAHPDILIVKINVDEIDPAVLEKYKVQSLPTLIYCNESGTELWRHNGLLTVQQLENKFSNEYTI